MHDLYRLVYCATLGHKANHSFNNNCVYSPYDHPRFGLIKCLQAVRDIRAGEELTVFYDYEHGDDETDENMCAPDWYRAEYQREAKKGGPMMGNALPEEPEPVTAEDGPASGSA